MASRKKKSKDTHDELFLNIQDLLTKTKAQLDSATSEPGTRPRLVKDLYQVATLAETIKASPKEGDSGHADVLDQEGVSLWNISGLVQKYPEDDGCELVGALRLAAFRLVEAGLEAKPVTESLLNILQLASKTGATLSELGKSDTAAALLSSAAKYEEMLRNMDDPDNIHRQAKACATVVYFSSRLEAAWKEGNVTIADFMSQKITGDEQRLALLPAPDRVLLASKFYAIGKTILKDVDGSKAADAILWLQKAFSVLDPLEDAAVPGIPQLKISILRTLARGYFLSGSFDRAEATVDEIIPSIDTQATAEHQDLRWLRLAILKRRKAGDNTILEAFKSLVDHMEFNEASITDILQELRTMSHQLTLVSAVHQHCIQRALMNGGDVYVDRLLLSLIIHCSKDQDHERAMTVISGTFTSLSEADYDFGKTPTTACLTILWKYGDREYQAKKWAQAANWYLAGGHKLFKSVNNAAAKCHRKAALCYIEQKEYTRANAVIRDCSVDEAPTWYVTFLTAVHQGLEEDAIEAIRRMTRAPDFDRKMLLLATQISHQSDMKIVLLSVLEELLRTLTGSAGETVTEALTLVRCIIRSVLKMLVEPGANSRVLINNVVAHFRTAKNLVEEAYEQGNISIIMRDVSWLWRTAYNCAVQGCTEWEDCDENISTLFNICRDLLEVCCQASPVDVDGELYMHLINASFSGISGRLFLARERMSATNIIDVNALRLLSEEVMTCKARISQILVESTLSLEGEDSQRIQYFLHVLQVFEVELSAYMKDWDRLLAIVGEVVASGPLAAETYEAVADIVWSEKDCPVDVLYSCLETLLRGSMTHKMSVEKFSRWLRAVCTIILARNHSGDRLKAIGYTEQALGVMEETSSEDDEDVYPIDERLWLLSTAYNMGSECLAESNSNEAKRWFELATVICRYVPGGGQRADKISQTYRRLLSQCTTDPSS